MPVSCFTIRTLLPCTLASLLMVGTAVGTMAVPSGNGEQGSPGSEQEHPGKGEDKDRRDSGGEKSKEDGEHSDSRLPAEPIPLAKLPARPKPILELGPHFLGTGRIDRGFRLPTGAVWQPSFLLFGSFRSGLSLSDDNVGPRVAQWANRLDLFGNLYLSGTERVVFGIRPLDETTDRGTRRFTGAVWGSGQPGAVSGGNFDWDTVTHLFFEGDFGEIFPNLDPDEKHSLDYGFSVGRQPVSFQEGLLINDNLDGVGITRNNLKPKGTVNFRVTGFFGWNQINRNTPSDTALIRNVEASGTRLFAVFTETDWRFSTVAVDAVFVRGGTFRQQGLEVQAGDGLYTGVSFVQRIGSLNSSFRVLGSIPIGSETPADNALAISDPAAGGALFFSEISWTPHHTEDLVYINGFAAIEDYRAAALDPTVPGPLARAGFLFAGSGLGNQGSALSSTASEVVGGAAGYQRFLAHTRQQLLLEAGGRYSTQDCPSPASSCGAHSLAGGARYQIAVGRRTVFVFDSYLGWDDLRGAEESAAARDNRFRFGSRIELLIKF